MVPAMFWLETGRVPELLEERLAVKISFREMGVDFTDGVLGRLVVVPGIETLTAGVGVVVTGAD